MAADVLHESRGVVRPGDRALGRAAADPARPVRGAARRPPGDLPVRRRGRDPRRRHAVTCVTPSPPSWRRCGRWPSASAPTIRLHRVERSRPRPSTTRVGSTGSCATCWPTRSSTVRVDPIDITRRRLGRRGGGRASATTAPGCGPGSRRWCSTASGGPIRRGRGRSGAPGSGCRSRSEDARLHGGWLQAWGAPGDGAQLPADPAAATRCRDRRVASSARARRRQHRPSDAAVGRRPACRRRQRSEGPQQMTRRALAGRSGDAPLLLVRAPRHGAGGMRGDPHQRTGGAR